MKQRPFRALFSLVPGMLACTSVAAQATGDPPNMYWVSPEQAQFAQEQGGVLEVTGTAEVSVAADGATISFAVETEAASAGEASSANAALMNTVLEALRHPMLGQPTIETFGYSLRPNYRNPRDGSSGPQIASYRALNHVHVTTDDVDRVGDLIDAAIGAGANRVANLQFTASNTEEARREALRQAVGMARLEAEAIAEALETPLGPPIEVRGGAQRPQGPQGVRFMALEQAPSTPVEAAGQVVRATVVVKFRLGG